MSTLADLRTELQARGFDYLSTSRATAFLNEAMNTLCEWDGIPWPFLEVTTTGVAPMTITDLREIIFVVDTTTTDRLEQADARAIVELDPAMTATGTPKRYWLDGLTSLKVWPANTTDALSVRYIKIPITLAADADVPLLPVRYHPLIVDQAEVLAYQETSDFQNANAKFALLVPKVARMRDTLLVRNDDDPDFMLVTNTDLGAWC